MPTGPGRTGLHGLSGVLALLRERRLWTGAALQRDARGFYRLRFLHTAMQTGLLTALRSPVSAEDAARRIGAARPALVQSLLELGVALGELAVEQGRYRLRGHRSRALAEDARGPLAALVREWVGYHGGVFDWLPDGLNGRPADDYLRQFGATIAQSSRVLEPLVGSFARTAARAAIRATPDEPRLLEVGCGSGIYLRYAAAVDSTLTGVGLEIDPSVAGQAGENLAAWGIGDRFRVAAVDARHLRDADRPRFALVTLYNNVYYFQLPERADLFAALRRHLIPGGCLALVSLFRSRDVDATAFELVLQSTPGCAPLPERHALQDQLVQAGFAHVAVSRLVPSTPLYGVLATA